MVLNLPKGKLTAKTGIMEKRCVRLCSIVFVIVAAKKVAKKSTLDTMIHNLTHRFSIIQVLAVRFPLCKFRTIRVAFSASQICRPSAMVVCHEKKLGCVVLGTALMATSSQFNLM